MGQQDSKPQVHVHSSRNVTYTPSQSRKRELFLPRPPPKRLHCDGLLRLQTTPFKNCIEIQTQTEVLFLENIEITLKHLLDCRLNTNKLFMLQDVEKLIEEISFTLAFLQENKITYKDIHPQNIFYDDGNFKLLPNELIEMNTYQKLKEDRDVYPSPELIIALRSGEEEVSDEEIIEIANVFTLGMVFLEVATLLPSSQCYDPNNFDILDDVIKERLVLVEDYYGEIVSSIISRMLDYDYQRRHNIKDLSIWINRQFQSSRVAQNNFSENKLDNFMISKVEKTDVKQNQKDKSRLKTGKNNSVYMGTMKDNDCSREERNKIYINEGPRQGQEISSKTISREQSKSSFVRQKNPYEIGLKHVERGQIGQDLTTYLQKMKNQDNQRCRQVHYDQGYQADKINLKKGNLYEKALLERDTTKRIVKEPTNPYRHQQNHREVKPYLDQIKYESKGTSNALKEMANQFYPKVEDLLKTKPQPLPNEPIQSMESNWDLRKLKEGIRNNRQLVLDLKRNQGLTS